MARLTVEIPDEMAHRVADAASEQGVAPETLAGQILPESFPSRRALRFLALGRSTDGHRAEDDEDMLAEGFGR